MLEELATIIRGENPEITFTLMEVGAFQVEENPEPFYRLIDLFPGSQIIGFEPDAEECDKMNAKAPVGVRYYPHALSERTGRRLFYITEAPECCSFYEPNESLNKLFNNLETSNLREKVEIDTLSMDQFARDNGISNVDFIKIDVQGAELDVFRGGVQVLESVLFIICEVEFMQHYIQQPLFGDVSGFLSEHQFMFHNFLGFGGRSLRPIVLNNNPNLLSQVIWSDAMFIRHVQSLHTLELEQLLKLSAFAALYGCPDLAYFCLDQYDQRKGTSLALDFLLKAGG